MTELGLAVDETIRDIHLSAKSGEPDYEFDWVNVVGNHDEFGFSFFNEFSDVVKTEFKVEWSLFID